MRLRTAWFAVMLASSPTGCKPASAKDCGQPVPTVAVTGLTNDTPTAPDGGVWIVDFGQVPVASRATAEVTVGSSCEVFSLLSMRPPSDPEFSIQRLSFPQAVWGYPQSGVPLQLSFVPQSEGQKTASVTIDTDTSAVPTITLILTGSGIH